MRIKNGGVPGAMVGYYGPFNRRPIKVWVVTVTRGQRVVGKRGRQVVGRWYFQTRADARMAKHHLELPHHADPARRVRISYMSW